MFIPHFSALKILRRELSSTEPFRSSLYQLLMVLMVLMSCDLFVGRCGFDNFYILSLVSEVCQITE